jgi:hypothetical protein
MGLNSDDIKILRCMMVETHHMTALSSDIGEDKQDLEFADAPLFGSMDLDQRRAIELAYESFTDWEKAVLQAAMEGSYGWQTTVAKEYVNPETGTTYSRAAPAIALGRIRDKVMEIYRSFDKRAA